MNNQKRCFFCHSSAMKFQPITNKKGEIISLHNICQSCNKNQTKHSLAKKKKTLSLNSKRTFKTSKPKSRLLKGMLVTLVSAALSYNACIGLASADFMSNTVSFQQTPVSSSTAPQSAQEAPRRTETPNPVPEAYYPSKEEFRTYFLDEAKKAGVWVEKAEHMMKVESGGWDAHARGDQKILENGNGMCKNKNSPLYGKPADARGGAQITRCWFSQISDEQADDYKFATKFMLDTILSGKDKCRMIYSTCDAWYKI